MRIKNFTSCIRQPDAGNGIAVSESGRCLTDTFTIGNQDTVPVICGTNSGEHGKKQESYFLKAGTYQSRCFFSLLRCSGRMQRHELSVWLNPSGPRCQSLQTIWYQDHPNQLHVRTFSPFRVHPILHRSWTSPCKIRLKSLVIKSEILDSRSKPSISTATAIWRIKTKPSVYAEPTDSVRFVGWLTPRLMSKWPEMHLAWEF